jgi:lipoprotein-anchoring transpeptidase ErfK/SrfK
LVCGVHFVAAQGWTIRGDKMKSPMKAMIAASCMVLSLVQVSAQKTQAKVEAAPAVAIRTAAAQEHGGTRVIVVSLEDRRLALVEDGTVKKVYRVAVGRGTSPSPTGTFTIVQRVENPTYYHDGKVIPPGPDNPVGTRWMGLSQKGYGIHGTNEPRSIGKAASHGCIRMGQKDLEELFAEMRSGDTVEIVGERNEETASIFGQPMTPGAASAAQVVTAKAAPAESEQSPAADVAATAMVTAVVPVSQ